VHLIHEHKAKDHFLFYLVVISTTIRCIIAANLELGNDEVYYWTYALHLQPGYFDHPPLVGLFIRLFTLNLQFNQEIFVRLTAIIGSAINTWLIYKILYKIKNKRAARYGALLYNACVYTSVISGLFILPDSPQVVFWMISIFLLIKIFILREREKLNMVLFGISVGICTLCKIHGLYLWFAAGLFILIFERAWLTKKYFWVSGLITAILMSPIIYWNYQNNFVTYNYHSQRVIASGGIHFSSFLTELSGEISYANPINFILIVIILMLTIKRKLFYEDKKLFSLLMLLSLPLIFIFWLISLFRDTLPHWPGPGYIALIIFTAYYGDVVFKNSKRLLKIIYAADIFLIVVVIGGYILINYAPANLGSTDATNLGSGDFTLDMYGWRNFETQAAELFSKDVSHDNMKRGAILLSNNWFPAAHLDYYVAQPLHMKLYAFGPLFNIHNFAWLNQRNDTIGLGTDAYYIAPSNYNSDPVQLFSKNFKIIESPLLISQYRNGKQVRAFYIYRMKDYLGGLELSIPDK
jgi:hypothetical protein